MHLEPNEVILKIFYHHYFPFAIRLWKLIFSTLPFYILLLIFADNLSKEVIFWSNFAIMFVFAIAIIYQTVIYWLDRLIVTNKRVVFVDWRYLTIKAEFEAHLGDIQDVRTIERGILAKIPFLDYGSIEIKTASDRSVINFPEAPDPEGIRKYIYQVQHNHHEK